MGRFLVKGIFFAASLAALLLASEVLVTSMTPWQRYEDPRARILWDGAFDGTRIVLLGDSVFASLYVDSPSEMLWARLEAYTGQRVFPGALNAARPPDVLAAAVRVSREWPDGTTVFINLPPTRFVASRAEEPPMGNFADFYLQRYGIDATSDGALRRLQEHMYRWFLRPFFAVRIRRALANLVDQPRPPRWMRNRVWSAEGEVAQDLFEFFERNLVLGASPRPFGWVEQIENRLEDAGMRPVFVLTPLNESLIRRFAGVHPADSILHHLRGAVAAVRTRLEERHTAVIDLTDRLPAECFFDLVHPNACGDDLIAKRLAAWLAERSAD